MTDQPKPLKTEITFSAAPGFVVGDWITFSGVDPWWKRFYWWVAGLFGVKRPQQYMRITGVSTNTISVAESDDA